ncbi:hypothetical protein ATANTOWER_020244 [Ataeniobius toweri]|uniref:Uncharacterized protein n=1 Tax=Ataeniobius toweri TaxID=208326 RepID=A0ABU7AYZ7_9TELE|nr:hypothetical protein [Ataeniobius toweri]
MGFSFGNFMCLSDDGVHLAAMARDICPFPNYTPNPHFMNMITADSASYLTEHYTVVQRFLSPKQLEDFTQSLKTTFGKEGKVTLGKVGVVALSLAVLFDTLAKQVRGETMSDMGPIPGFFIKEPSGYYPPHVYTMSKCLRLIPHIANNPTRMRQVTESCSTQLIADNNAFKQLRQNNTLPYGEDITAINLMMGNTFEAMLRIYLTQATNTTLHLENKFERNLQNISAFSLNCDPIAADK